jgi:wobble nucleotide-excising tRNase
MITKIEKLKNIGNFEDYTASGDVTLKPFCIVYAENGAGKTTLSRVFHSLSTNDADVVIRHKRIGGAGNPEITLNNETPSPFVFSGTHWNRPCPEIEVFDAHFVANNVYSGFNMNSDHHKGLYQFVVGASGVVIINKIDRVKDKIAALNTEIAQQGELIKATANYHDAEQVCNLVQKPNVDDEIGAKDKELTQAKNQEQIRTQAVPQAIQIPALPFEFARIKAVMELTVEGIGKEYLDRVEAQTKKLADAGMQNVSEWVFRGASVKGDACPFCGQDLHGAAELIEGYNQYFSKAYRDASSASHAVKSGLGSMNVANYLLQLSSQYKRIEDSMKYWATVIAPEKALPAFPLAELKIEEKFNKLLEIIRIKAGNPIAAVNTDTLDAFQNGLNEVQKLCGEVNQWVTDYVSKITALRAKMRPVADVEKEMKALMIYKARYEQPLKGQCEKYLMLCRHLVKWKEINTKLQQQQKSASNLLFQQYGQKTNDYLHNVFMTPFQIVNVKDGGFRGGSRRPNLDYTLTFNGTDILQDEGMQNTSFKNVLSEGDKNTIAFSFFLAKLTSDPDFANKIVVFDDPLTSLDQNRRHATIDQLMMLHSRCKQVIVLSHNLHFLIDLNSRYEVRKQDKKVLMILKGANNATLEPFELKREWMDKFKRGVMSMEDFVNHPHPNKQEEAVNAIRLTLELMLKLKCCTYLTDEGTTFGEVIAELEHKPCAFVNPNKAEVIAKLKNLNSISWRTHHATIEERAVYREVTLTMTEAVNYTRQALQMLQREI